MYYIYSNYFFLIVFPILTTIFLFILITIDTFTNCNIRECLNYFIKIGCELLKCSSDLD